MLCLLLGLICIHCELQLLSTEPKAEPKVSPEEPAVGAPGVAALAFAEGKQRGGSCTSNASQASSASRTSVAPTAGRQQPQQDAVSSAPASASSSGDEAAQDAQNAAAKEQPHGQQEQQDQLHQQQQNMRHKAGDLGPDCAAASGASKCCIAVACLPSKSQM